MKHNFNFISRMLNGGSTAVDTPVTKRSQVSNKCRLTVGRLSTLIFALFLCVGQMWAGDCTFKKGTTIYLNLNGNEWPKDGGKPSAMFYYLDNPNMNYGDKSTSWGGELTESKQIGSGNYVLGTQVSGDYWKVTVPDDGLAYVRFVRVQASNAEWTWNCQKNKLSLADMGGNNCVKLGGWDANASWENYSSGTAVEKDCGMDYWVVSDNNNWVKYQSTYKMHSGEPMGLKLINIKGSKGLDFYLLDAEGNTIGFDKFSTSKSTNITSATAGSKTGSIKLSFESTSRNISIFYDGTNIYAIADHINTHSTQLAFPGDFNSWSNSGHQLSQSDNYAHTVTVIASAASGHDSQRAKVVKSGSWDNQLGNEQIDALSSCYPVGNDWENYDNRILIKCDGEMAITPTVWKADGDTKWLTLIAIPTTKYNVTFSSAHGSVPATQSVAYDGVPSKPADPSESGWTFQGWYTSDQYTKEYDFSVAIHQATTIYAKWENSTPVSHTYFLQHPWGTGDDKDWSWKECDIDNGDGTYSLVAKYGGNNKGCDWKEDDTYKGYVTPTFIGSPTTGDECTFTLNPTAGTITITKNVAPTPTAYYIGGRLGFSKAEWGINHPLTYDDATGYYKYETGKTVAELSAKLDNADQYFIIHTGTSSGVWYSATNSEGTAFHNMKGESNAYSMTKRENDSNQAASRRFNFSASGDNSGPVTIWFNAKSDIKKVWYTVPAPAPKFYVMGGGDNNTWPDWNKDKTFEMSYNSSTGIYSRTFTNVTGTKYFKVYDESSNEYKGNLITPFDTEKKDEMLRQFKTDNDKDNIEIAVEAVADVTIYYAPNNSETNRIYVTATKSPITVADFSWYMMGSGGPHSLDWNKDDMMNMAGDPHHLKTIVNGVASVTYTNVQQTSFQMKVFRGQNQIEFGCQYMNASKCSGLTMSHNNGHGDDNINISGITQGQDVTFYFDGTDIWGVARTPLPDNFDIVGQLNKGEDSKWQGNATNAGSNPGQGGYFANDHRTITLTAPDADSYSWVCDNNTHSATLDWQGTQTSQTATVKVGLPGAYTFHCVAGEHTSKSITVTVPYPEMGVSGPFFNGNGQWNHAGAGGDNKMTQNGLTWSKTYTVQSASDPFCILQRHKFAGPDNEGWDGDTGEGSRGNKVNHAATINLTGISGQRAQDWHAGITGLEKGDQVIVTVEMTDYDTYNVRMEQVAVIYDAYLEGRLSIRSTPNGARDKRIGDEPDKWDLNSTRVQFTWDETNQYYYLNTYCSPRELSQNEAGTDWHNENWMKVYLRYNGEWKKYYQANGDQIFTTSNTEFTLYTDKSSSVRFDKCEDDRKNVVLYFKPSNGKFWYTADPEEKVTVSFNTKGGSSIDPVQVTKGGKLASAPANPTKTDYSFIGWSETTDGNVVDVTNITINDDKTFYAIWHQFTIAAVLTGTTATVTPTLPAHHGALTFCYTVLDKDGNELAEQPAMEVENGIATFTVPTGGAKVQCKVHNGADCSADVIATIETSLERTTPTNIAIHVDTDKWGRTTGQSFTLTVTGNNIDADATYQWYRDENVVSGATASTYTVTSCTKDHAGEYKCVVSNGNKSAENADKHTLKVYSLLITVNGNNNYYDFVHTNGDEGQVTVFMDGAWKYEMKIYDNSGKDGYYGNDGMMTGQYCTDFAFDKTKGNCKIETSMGGDYIFTVKYGNDNNPSLSATYPLANQPSGKTIYFVNSENWDNLHYRIGHNTNSAAQALTKVPGTEKLYKVVTNEYNSVDAWSIANNAGWTGNERTIYQPYDDNGTIKPNDNFAITRQTTFQKYIVSNPITLNPSLFSNTNNECDYWHADKTDGMLSHKVTISDYAHGTVTVAYTDVDDHAQSMTSGNADLAHTCYLDISCASAQGYQVTSFQVNGVDFISESQIILTEDITITATITPNTNTPYKVNHYKENVDGTYPSTPTETENKTGTTDTQVTPDRKSYEGFNTPDGQEITIAADGSTVVNYNYTRKVNDVTYTAQGKGWTYGTKPENAKYGATVNFVVTPETGYEVTVSSPDVTIIQSGNDYSFTMPNEAVSVTVSATFTAQLTLEATPAIPAPNATVTATPTNLATDFPTDIMICYALYKGTVADANKVDVEFTITKSGTNKGQATFTAPEETGTYIVQADVHRGNDCSAETILSSAQATITVKPLTNTFTNNNGEGDNKWSTDANWSEKMLPDAEMDVIIQAKAIVDINTAAAKTVVIDDNGHNAEIEILSTGGLQVEGTITRTEDGSTYGPTTIHDLYIHSDVTGTGALVFDNSNNCQAYVEMYSKAYLTVDGGGKKTKYWQYLGSPVNGVTMNEHFVGAYTYLYEEVNGGWTRVKTGEMTPWKGWGITQDNATTYLLNGTLQPTTEKVLNLTYTADGAEGDNLMANSWTAPIDITKMETSDFGEGATATIYMYNTGRDPVYGQATYGEGTNDEPGQWVTIPVNAAKETEWKGPKAIPSMQVFEIFTGKTTTLTLDYDKVVRHKDAAIGTDPLRAPARKADNEDAVSMMRIRVEGQNMHVDQYLLEGENFTTGFDNGWDGDFMEGDGRSASFYSVNAELGDMAVNALPNIDGTLLGFVPNDEQAFTIRFGYNGDKTYYLNDLMEQKSTLIRNDQTYFFLVGGNDITHRFQISTTPFESYIGTGSDYIGDGAQKAVKFIENDKFFILRNGRLYDGTGKALKPGK